MTSKNLLVGLCLAALAAPAPGQADESKAISAFSRAFKRSRKPPSPEARIAAIEQLGSFDSVAFVKALTKAYETLETERAVLETQREDLMTKLRKMLGGREFTNARPGDFKRIEALAGDARQALESHQGVIDALSLRIGGLRGPESVTWLVSTVCGTKKYPLSLKILAARTAGGVGVVSLPPLTSALDRAVKKVKDPAEIAAIIDGIGILKEGARSAAPRIIEQLKHRDELVREHAALALSVICDPKAIEPMIELLATSHGQTKKRVAAYLEALTRQQHGDSAGVWRRWFQADGGKYLAGEAQMGGGEASAKKQDKSRYAYFGIPQDGKSIIYIIDSSGSMKKMIKLRLPQPPPATDGADRGDGTRAKMRKKKPEPGRGKSEPRESTRLEACKAELIRALGKLQPTTSFNVIWYNEMPHRFQDGMQKADKTKIKAAQDWVRRLQPNSSTNIYDSLKMAFKLTGMVAGGAKERRGPTTGRSAKNRPPIPDTIFLLTDGSPTIPPGNKLDSTEKIIKAVRKWNALKSVVIHTIGIGGELNAPFLQKLAQENNGEFRRY